MTPQDFIDSWCKVELKERSASQSHFNTQCDLLGLVKPIEADLRGEWFMFGKEASKSSVGEGWPSRGWLPSMAASSDLLNWKRRERG